MGDQDWHRCQQRLADGQICGKPFTRPDNLRRHIRTQHPVAAQQAQGPVQVAEAAMQQTQPPPPQGFVQVAEAAVQQIQPPPPQGFAQLAEAAVQQIQPLPAGFAQLAEAAVQQIQPLPAGVAQLAGAAVQQIQPPPLQGLVQLAEAIVQHIDQARPAAPYLAAEDLAEDEVRLRRFRPGRLVYTSVMPGYDTKRSRKYPRQQKGLVWLAVEAKEHMDRHLEAIMTSWGVRTTHRGTCLLMPADWECAAPTTIAARFSAETCPGIDTPHARYIYADFSTGLSRAIVWFTETWPRTGIQLDNFIECGPYQRMDCSHRCHNSLCLNPSHLTLEPAEVNLSRFTCLNEAKMRRRDDLDVPATCQRHEPPCLLQHAALTTYERFQIQFWVLRQALGQGEPTVQRPRWHPFRTLETRLPLSFLHQHGQADGVRLRPEDLVDPAEGQAGSGSGQTVQTPKPSFLCVFCPKIKSFKSVIAYWGHIVHKHAEAPVADRLEEMCCTARTWRTYTSQFRPQQSTEPTRKKLELLLDEECGWETVLQWRLK